MDTGALDSKSVIFSVVTGITDMRTKDMMSAFRGPNTCSLLTFCALVIFSAFAVSLHMMWDWRWPLVQLPKAEDRPDNGRTHGTSGLYSDNPDDLRTDIYAVPLPSESGMVLTDVSGKQPSAEAKDLSTSGTGVAGSADGRAVLDEFQSALDKTGRQFLVLKRVRSEARLPAVTTVNCSLLWEGDRDELQRALLLVNATRPRSRPERFYLEETENCTRYVLKGGFKMTLVSELERRFPLAFSLLVYKDVEQVERLLRAIYRPHNVYCIHIDRKSDVSFHMQLRLIIGCLPNVLLAERSFSVVWGTSTVLEPELECMRRLWSHPTRWRYFINLTGQEFPLKTNRELVQILKAFRGANDIGLLQDGLFFYRWFRLPPPPHNLAVTKAPVHIIASRGYVDYVLHSHMARDFLAWVRPSYIPDETFFGTLNHNPSLGVPGSYLGMCHRSDTNSTDKASFASYKIWRFENPTLCGGRWERKVCHFGLADLQRLTHSPQLFANKFTQDFMPLAYDCMEEWYFQKIALENQGLSPSLNVSMYENADFVRQQYTGPVRMW